MLFQEVFLFFITVIFQFGVTKRAQGIISSRKDFLYLDRFCFQSDTGTLEYTFKYPLFYPTQMLLLYYDTDDQWPKAYKKLNTCEERVELLTNRSENNQIIRLNPYQADLATGGRCQIIKDSISEEWIQCSGTRVFRSARSRWWFLAIANCDPNESEEKRTFMNDSIGVYAEFSLQMTNGLPSEVLKYQFSIDEWLILPSDTLFLILQVFLMIVCYFMGISLSSRRLYHNTYRMCSQSIILNTIGLSFLVTNHVIYAIDGIGLPVIKTLGQFIRAVGDMLFVYMCLVLSRGLNVSKMMLTTLDKIFLCFMVVIFICTYMLMQMWEMKYYDPAAVYSQSESVAGYLLALWRFVAWCFFTGATLVSRKEAPRKEKFFTYFLALMTPWFWAQPITLFIANFALNSWVRAEVVNIIDNVISFYGYCVFLWLSRPTNGNTNFPFHIRTTQVDVDVGFDPQTAYADNEGVDLRDGMHGTQIELSARSENNDNPLKFNDDDKGLPARPQYS